LRPLANRPCDAQKSGEAGCQPAAGCAGSIACPDPAARLPQTAPSATNSDATARRRHALLHRVADPKLPQSCHWGHPFQFALNYYAHFPKVALGHRPPLFELQQTAWSLVFGVSRPSMMWEMAVLTAFLAAVVFPSAFRLRRRWRLERR